MYETKMHGKTKIGRPEKQISQAEARDLRLAKAKEQNPAEQQAGKGKGYIEKFNNQQVKVNLVNGEVLTGKLRTDYYNKYEYLLEEENFGSMAIRKDAVAYIRFKEV